MAIENNLNLISIRIRLRFIKIIFAMPNYDYYEQHITHKSTIKKIEHISPKILLSCGHWVQILDKAVMDKTIK